MVENRPNQVLDTAFFYSVLAEAFNFRDSTITDYKSISFHAAHEQQLLQNLSTTLIGPQVRIHILVYSIENPISIPCELFELASCYSIFAVNHHMKDPLSGMKFVFEFYKRSSAARTHTFPSAALSPEFWDTYDQLTITELIYFYGLN